MNIIITIIIIIYLYSEAYLRGRDLLNYLVDVFKIDIFRNFMIRRWWQSLLSSSVPSQTLYFNKKIWRLRSIMLTITKTMRSTRHILASLGLRWWHHMNVRVLHEHCVARKLLDLENLSLYPVMSIRSYHSLPTMQKTISNKNWICYDNQ
jgi:hypothetical protein